MAQKMQHACKERKVCKLCDEHFATLKEAFYHYKKDKKHKVMEECASQRVRLPQCTRKAKYEELIFCDECSFVCGSKKSIRRHIWHHVFGDSKGLNMTVRTRNYECTVCGLKKHSPLAISRHMLRDHSSTRCKLCGKNYNKEHYCTPSERYRFVCSCEKTFNFRFFNQHMKKFKDHVLKHCVKKETGDVILPENMDKNIIKYTKRAKGQ